MPGHWLPWGRLAEVARRGERQTVAALGHKLFDYYAVNPGEGGAFTGAMANFFNAIARTCSVIHLRKLFSCAGISHSRHPLGLTRGHSLCARGRNASSPGTVLRIFTRSQGSVVSAGVLIWVRYMS